MGDRIVEVLIKAKDTTATALGRFQRRMRSVRRVIRNVTRTVVASTAAIGAMALGLTKLGERGDKVNAVKQAFAKITRDETAALQELRTAAQGTISDFELMSLANQAMTLGAADSVEQFAEMVEVSRALARAQGIDARRGLESLTIGLARQSPRILDNIGIQIQLGDATTFAARAMEQARQKAAEYTASVEPGTAATVRFSTALANLRDRLAEFVAESPSVARAFDFGTEILSNVADIVQGRNVDLIIEGMKTIGRAMGDALAFGFNKAIEAGIDKGNFFGRWVAGKFGERAAENIAALRDELGRLGVIASFARQQIEGGGGGGGAVSPSGGGGAARGPASIPGVGAISSRFIPQVRLSPAPIRTSMAAALVGPSLNLPPNQDVPEAAESFEEAGQVAVAAFGSMAEAAIRGSDQVAASIIGMVTNILRSLPGVGGFAGALIGGIGGIAGALFSGRRDPVPVRMTDIDNRAADKLRDSSREPLNITSIIQMPDGTVLSIEQVELALAERQRRNATVRYGQSGRAFQTRGSG